MPNHNSLNDDQLKSNNSLMTKLTKSTTNSNNNLQFKQFKKFQRQEQTNILTNNVNQNQQQVYHNNMNSKNDSSLIKNCSQNTKQVVKEEVVKSDENLDSSYLEIVKKTNYLIDNISNQRKTHSNMPRVLIFTESFHPYTSGIARRFKEIIERLSKRGFLIHIVTGCKGGETWTNDIELKDKVTFSILKAIEFKDKIDCALPFLLPQYGIIKAILEFKPDVIHCVEQTPASTFCGALAKTLDIPIVWSSHTNLDFYIPLYIYPLIAPISLRVYQLLRRTFLNLADYNLTVSSDFVKLLNENGIRQTVNVWKTGVDSESFNPTYRSHEMRLKMFNGHYSPEKILLVSVGRLSPEKNFEFLFKLLKRFPQTFLCIVGGGPYKEHLEPLFPPNQTHFMGFLQGEQLASAYASADYFVYASVSETFGQVYLEAMSSGTPIVAAEGQQMKEFFINGIHGYTWKPNDVNSAVKALNNAIKERSILSQNCRSNALNHSWNSAANQIAEVYTNLTFKSSLRTNKPKTSISLLRSVFNFGAKIIRGVYYLSVWFYIMILVLTLMAPFMKVAKPINDTSLIEQSSKQINSEDKNQSAKKKKSKKNRKKKTNASLTNSTSSAISSRKSSNFEIIDKEELVGLVNVNVDDSIETASTSSSKSSCSTFTNSSSSSSNSKKSKRHDRNKKKLMKSDDNVFNKLEDLSNDSNFSTHSSLENLSSLSSYSTSSSSSDSSISSLKNKRQMKTPPSQTFIQQGEKKKHKELWLWLLILPIITYFFGKPTKKNQTQKHANNSKSNLSSKDTYRHTNTLISLIGETLSLQSLHSRKNILSTFSALIISILVSLTAFYAFF